MNSKSKISYMEERLEQRAKKFYTGIFALFIGSLFVGPTEARAQVIQGFGSEKFNCTYKVNRRTYDNAPTTSGTMECALLEQNAQLITRVGSRQGMQVRLGINGINDVIRFPLYLSGSGNNVAKSNVQPFRVMGPNGQIDALSIYLSGKLRHADGIEEFFGEDITFIPDEPIRPARSSGGGTGIGAAYGAAVQATVSHSIGGKFEVLQKNSPLRSNSTASDMVLNLSSKVVASASVNPGTEKFIKDRCLKRSPQPTVYRQDLHSPSDCIDSDRHICESLEQQPVPGTMVRLKASQAQCNEETGQFAQSHHVEARSIGVAPYINYVNPMTARAVSISSAAPVKKFYLCQGGGSSNTRACVTTNSSETIATGYISKDKFNVPLLRALYGDANGVAKVWVTSRGESDSAQAGHEGVSVKSNVAGPVEIALPSEW